MQGNLDGEFAISPSAHRHQVTDEQIRHALRQHMWSYEKDERFVMVVGPDDSGQLIEVGIVYPADGAEPIVVHAMPVRQSYLSRGHPRRRR